MTDELCAEVAVPAEAELGEGPLWDEESGTLIWVDLLADRVHRSDPATGTTTTLQLATTPGAVVTRAAGGLVAAIPDGFAALDEAGNLELLAVVGSDPTELRMNDGKCAPDGSFWAGTMHRDAVPGAGTLYRLAPDLSVRPLLSGLTVSNGLAFAEDGSAWFIDTADQRVDRLLIEDDGRWRRLPFVSIPRERGVPDGMAIDAEGNLWVAMCFGGSVLGFDPSGELRAVVAVPASLTTSVAFGGSGLDLLFVTTGRSGLSDEQLRDEPHAGSVFVARTRTTGTPATPFAG